MLGGISTHKLTHTNTIYYKTEKKSCVYVRHVNQFGLSPGRKKYFNINNKLSRRMEIFIEFSVWVGRFAYWKYRVLGMELKLE